jgi:hypothetical protein
MGSDKRISLVCLTTASVRCKKAPSGSWISTKNAPLFSSGCNPLGKVSTSQPTSAIQASNYSLYFGCLFRHHMRPEVGTV